MAKGRILIVDDEASILRSLEGILTDEGFDVVQARDGETALRLLEAQPCDLVLLDLWMPGIDGIQMLQRLQTMQSHVSIIVMSGHGNIETAVKATRLGAFDYLEKPLSLDTVLNAVNAACEHLWKSRQQPWLEVLRGTTEPLIGVSAAVQALQAQIDAATQHDSPLLIVGEPGSGKEFLARLMHQRQCPQGLLVRLACAVLSEHEVERLCSQDGSLSRLVQDLAETDGDADLEVVTLYLDGLERLSTAARHALTSLLSDSQLQARRRGGGVPRRIMAARLPSNWREAESGVLAAELQRVFATPPLATIPLRQRVEDIPLLAAYYLRRAAGASGASPRALHHEALQALMAYAWPGNVSELKATLERLVLTTPPGTIGVEHLPQHLIEPAGAASHSAASTPHGSLKQARRAWERQYLVEQLRQHQGNTAQAAQALRLNERSLQRRLQLLGITQHQAPRRAALPQRTLQRSVVIHGQGLQSGVKTGMILSPLPPNSGILFGDIATGHTIPATAAYVESTGYATTLRRGLVTARTVEHIMAALHMYGLTNVLVKIGGEVPFMDGSAHEFCQLIEAAGVEEQAAEAARLEIHGRYLWGREEPEQKHFVIEPAPCLTISYHLHYPPPIGRQQYTFIAESAEHFKATIAPARTFGFVKEIEQLHALGMANGGRLTNVILVDESHIINTELRFPDEFVRHKVLDLLGDLYLTGKFVQGKITAHLTGHTENLALVKYLLSISGEA